MPETRQPAPPAHRTPALMAVVAAGGALGAVARSEAAHLAASAWTTFVVNIIGSFVLGCLLEALTRSGPDTGHRRTIRLFAGTGFCGAFTTYSTFVHDVVGRSAGSALLFGVGEVAAGILAAALGAWLASRTVGRPVDAGGSPASERAALGETPRDRSPHGGRSE